MAPALDGSASASPSPADLTVVVPVRNAERLLEGCLSSVDASAPREVIVVDGLSRDGSRSVARRHGATVLSDEGRGLPAARMMGVEAASTRWVALVDADVVLPPGALAALLREFVDGGYVALQAGLESTSGPGYWGRALTFHHRTGRSRNWFGVVATVMERETLLTHGFDHSFRSGEDIDLRWRLRQVGRIGVSRRTVVQHRFDGDTFDFARDQFLMDGTGLGRMVRTRGVRAAHLLALPLAAGVRGSLLSAVRGQPRWIPYFTAFTAYNYVGVAHGLRTR
ncbi:glycosyltransferase family 2 protein [Georgenia ruanii]|uniref:4,4'-diaponeurosporenoate glycosyltransferase n=1 Tax=Georgenia ruanii TaxID=348442 RepID=A0A7J9UUR8_9MICO|nr:glycosyltransferase family 2 protein [Georgenia ruanii]MPV88093.1 glycosyltransferase [Georgenia ruanii]